MINISNELKLLVKKELILLHLSGGIDKYMWVDIRSLYISLGIIYAFLYAQFENMDKIHENRIKLWNKYKLLLHGLAAQGLISLPYIPELTTVNGYLLYNTSKNTQ